MNDNRVLDVIDQSIDGALKLEGIMPETRATLQALKYLVGVSRGYEQTSRRVETMWPAYLWGRWAMALVGVIGISDLITRILALIGK